MIKLLPNSSNQTISIVPREFPSVGNAFDNISLLIKEDGTGVIEELTDLEATVSSDNSNYVNITISSTILREGYAYYLEFKTNALKFKDRVIEDSGVYESSDCINNFLDNFGRILWFRDKAYITSQTDKAIKHTLNTNEYEEYSLATSDYIIL